MLFTVVHYSISLLLESVLLTNNCCTLCVIGKFKNPVVSHNNTAFITLHSSMSDSVNISEEAGELLVKILKVKTSTVLLKKQRRYCAHAGSHE